MRTYFIIIALLLGFTASSQNLPSSRNQISANFALDPHLSYQLRYDRKLPGILKGVPTYVYSEIRTPLQRSWRTNFDLRLGGRTAVFSIANFKIIGDLNASYGKGANSNFEAQKFALEAKLALGFYTAKRFVALCVSDEKILATKLEHSQYYMDRFYAEAKDAWYKGAGGTVEIGLEMGINWSPSLGSSFALKVPLTEKLKPYRGSPAHLQVGLNYQF